MGEFSGALQLTDLNDFLGPGQECILPVNIPKTKTSSPNVRINPRGVAEEVRADGSVKSLKKAEITLADCLACSGCVTTAESVLISEQSHSAFEKVLKADAGGGDRKTIVVSFSRQALASIAVKFSMRIAEAERRLCSFFKSQGVDYCFDLEYAHQLAVRGVSEEFVERYHESRLPMFTSACPGWICYAEKSVGDVVLPHIANTKSPQQIMGSMLKRFGEGKGGVYHCTLMMCYDKKLEASRSDFYDEVMQTRDVDMVITPIEVMKWMEEMGVALRDFKEEEMDDVGGFVRIAGGEKKDLIEYRDSGSGGYLEHAVLFASRRLFGRELSRDGVEYKVLRNQDFQEVSVEVDGEVKLRFAICYGFRNIQNVVQKMKRKKLGFDFVEIMACPSGCLNGGGQIRCEDVHNRAKAKELLKKVKECFAKERGEMQTGDMQKLFDSKEECDKVMRTVYHKVESNVNALAVSW